MRAELTQDVNMSDCEVDGYAVATCSTREAGAATLRVEVQGQTVTRDIEIGLTTLHDCDHDQDVELVLPGEGCPRPLGIAIEGRLIDVAGKEMNGWVEAQVLDRRAACVVNRGRFRCPSMTPYTATYRLRALLGGGVVAERDAVVLAVDCDVKPEDGTIDLRSGDVTLHVDP